MVELLLVLAVFCAFVCGWCARVVIVWWVKREALSITGKQKQILSTQSKNESKADTALLMADLVPIIQGEGKTEEKLTKALALMVKHPEGSEAIFNKVLKFKNFL
jgi:hypothetical protein